MSTEILGACYLVLSALLFFYAVRSYESCLRAYGYAIALNVFPLAWSPYLTNEEATRIGRVPIAYLPLCAAMAASLLLTQTRVRMEDRGLRGFGILFLAFTAVQSLWVAASYRSLVQYYAMWVLNIWTMLAVSYMVSRLSAERRLRLVADWTGLIAICACVGVARSLLGISPDANFMPMMNRNGTAFLIVITLPLILMLRDVNAHSFRTSLMMLAPMGFCLVLNRSRMGLFGAVFALMVYFGFVFQKSLIYSMLRRRTSAASVSIAVAVVLVVSGLAISGGYHDKLASRFEQTWETLQRVASREDSSEALPDNKRIRLCEQAVELIQERFWWGTGVGLTNYQTRLEELGAVELSKPHNFYLSAPAEFGAVGSGILALFLAATWFATTARSRNELTGDRHHIAFKTIFLSVMFMLSMNEYITYPMLWAIWGVGLGFNSPGMRTRARAGQLSGGLADVRADRPFARSSLA